jgi:hypothetical protein
LMEVVEAIYKSAELQKEIEIKWSIKFY